MARPDGWVCARLLLAVVLCFWLGVRPTRAIKLVSDVSDVRLDGPYNLTSIRNTRWRIPESQWTRNDDSSPREIPLTITTLDGRTRAATMIAYAPEAVCRGRHVAYVPRNGAVYSTEACITSRAATAKPTQVGNETVQLNARPVQERNYFEFSALASRAATVSEISTQALEDRREADAASHVSLMSLSGGAAPGSVEEQALRSRERALAKRGRGVWGRKSRSRITSKPKHPRRDVMREQEARSALATKKHLDAMERDLRAQAAQVSTLAMKAREHLETLWHVHTAKALVPAPLTPAKSRATLRPMADSNIFDIANGDKQHGFWRYSGTITIPASSVYIINQCHPKDGEKRSVPDAAKRTALWIEVNRYRGARSPAFMRFGMRAGLQNGAARRWYPASANAEEDDNDTNDSGRGRYEYKPLPSAVPCTCNALCTKECARVMLYNSWPDFANNASLQLTVPSSCPQYCRTRLELQDTPAVYATANPGYRWAPQSQSKCLSCMMGRARDYAIAQGLDRCWRYPDGAATSRFRFDRMDCIDWAFNIPPSELTICDTWCHFVERERAGGSNVPIPFGAGLCVGADPSSPTLGMCFMAPASVTDTERAEGYVPNWPFYPSVTRSTWRRKEHGRGNVGVDGSHPLFNTFDARLGNQYMYFLGQESRDSVKAFKGWQFTYDRMGFSQLATRNQANADYYLEHLVVGGHKGDDYINKDVTPFGRSIPPGPASEANIMANVGQPEGDEGMYCHDLLNYKDYPENHESLPYSDLLFKDVSFTGINDLSTENNIVNARSRATAATTLAKKMHSIGWCILCQVLNAHYSSDLWQSFAAAAAYASSVNELIAAERAYVAAETRWVNATYEFWSNVTVALASATDTTELVARAANETFVAIQQTQRGSIDMLRDFVNVELRRRINDSNYFSRTFASNSAQMQSILSAQSAAVRGWFGNLTALQEEQWNNTAALSRFESEVFVNSTRGLRAVGRTMQYVVAGALKLASRELERRALTYATHFKRRQHDPRLTPFLLSLGTPPDLEAAASDVTGDPDAELFSDRPANALPRMILGHVRILSGEYVASGPTAGHYAHQISLRHECRVEDVFDDIVHQVPTYAVFANSLGPTGCVAAEEYACKCFVTEVRYSCRLLSGRASDVTFITGDSCAFGTATRTEIVHTDVVTLRDSLESSCSTTIFPARAYWWYGSDAVNATVFAGVTNATGGSWCTSIVDDYVTDNMARAFAPAIMGLFVKSMQLVMLTAPRLAKAVDGEAPQGMTVRPVYDGERVRDGARCLRASYMMYETSPADNAPMLPVTVWECDAPQARVDLFVDGVLYSSSTEIEYRNPSREGKADSFISVGSVTDASRVYSPPESLLALSPSPEARKGRITYNLQSSSTNISMQDWAVHNPGYEFDADSARVVPMLYAADIDADGRCTRATLEDGTLGISPELMLDGLCGMLLRNRIRALPDPNTLTVSSDDSADSYTVLMQAPQGQLIEVALSGCPVVSVYRSQLDAFTVTLSNVLVPFQISVIVESEGACPFSSGVLLIPVRGSRSVIVPICGAGVSSTTTVRTYDQEGRLEHRCGPPHNTTRVQTDEVNYGGIISTARVRQFTTDVVYEPAVRRAQLAYAETMVLIVNAANVLHSLYGSTAISSTQSDIIAALAERAAESARAALAVATSPNDNFGGITEPELPNVIDWAAESERVRGDFTAATTGERARIQQILAEARAQNERTRQLTDDLTAALTAIDGIAVLVSQARDIVQFLQIRTATRLDTVVSAQTMFLERTKKHVLSGFKLNEPPPRPRKCSGPFKCAIEKALGGVGASFIHGIELIPGLVVDGATGAFGWVWPKLRALYDLVESVIGGIARAFGIAALIVKIVIGVLAALLVWYTYNRFCKRARDHKKDGYEKTSGGDEVEMADGLGEEEPASASKRGKKGK